MAKRTAKLIEPKEDGFAHHYGMVLGALVAVVAVVGLVILLSGELTGNAVNNVGYDRNVDSVCGRECYPYSGKPIGHHGLSGIIYCLCSGPKQ